MVQTDRVVRKTTHSVSIALRDCTDAIPSKEGITNIQPDYLSIEWRYIHGDGWVLIFCHLFGINIRTDSTTGRRTNVSKNFATYNKLTVDTPDWLREIVNEYAPHGTVLIP